MIIAIYLKKQTKPKELNISSLKQKKMLQKCPATSCYKMASELYWPSLKSINISLETLMVILEMISSLRRLNTIKTLVERLWCLLCSQWLAVVIDSLISCCTLQLSSSCWARLLELLFKKLTLLFFSSAVFVIEDMHWEKPLLVALMQLFCLLFVLSVEDLQ